MANKVLQRVWDYSQQRGAARCLVLAIADVADVDGIAYPGVAYLARMICEDEDYTYRLLRKVIDSGELLHRPGGGRGRKTLYAVTCGLSEPQIERLNTVLQSRVLRDKNTAPKSREKKNPGLQNSVIDSEKPWTLSDSKQASFEALAPPETPIAKNGIHDHDPWSHGGGDRARASRTIPKGVPRHVAYLLDKGMSAAAEFAHLDSDTAITDFEARRNAGIPTGTIVETWRVSPPAPGAIYERRSVDAGPATPAPEARSGTHPHRRRTERPGARGSDAGGGAVDPAVYEQILADAAPLDLTDDDL